MKKWTMGILLVLLTVGISMPISANAATEEQKEACKEEILDMLYSADTEKRDVLQYQLTKEEVLQVWDEIRFRDGVEILGAYHNTIEGRYYMAWFSKYVQYFQLLNVNEDVLDRYEQMVPVIDTIIDGIEAEMTDVDKLIYLHDVIVETVEYKDTNVERYIASGALVDKQAVCAGYTKALNILLQRVGIQTTYVYGSSLNHGWSYVNIDGQWYHVDSTWDDDITATGPKTSRKHLLRNDEEFSNDHGVWEVKLETEASDSTAYEDWLVHDITGTMRFEDGLWYYYDASRRAMMAVDAVNNWEEELFSASCLGTVELIDVLDDQIILQVNGKEFSRTVEEWELAAEEAEEMLSNTGTLPIDFSDISYWRTGHYDATYGSYCKNQNRICLNDLIENTQEHYVVTINQEEYKVAIREYNERKKIIGSAELGDGEVYLPSEGTVYLGITIYNNVQEKGITFSQYEELFADGLMVGFNLGATVSNEENEEEIPEELPEVGDISMDFSDISYWRTGHYDATFGAYCLNQNRICLNDLIENTAEQYRVVLSCEDYKIAIREYNERRKITGSAELGDGEVYIPSEGTVYLGISIYNIVQEKGITFSHYEELFADGLMVGFGLDDTEEMPEEVPEETPETENISMDFSDSSYWRTGHYDATFGAYCLNQNRICLNDLIENTAEQYRVVLSCEDYKIAIREYNERRKITGSAELGDGEVYIPSEGTVYLGISIYNIVQEKGITFAKYEELFADGLVVGFILN